MVPKSTEAMGTGNVILLASKIFNHYYIDMHTIVIVYSVSPNCLPKHYSLVNNVSLQQIMSP